MNKILAILLVAVTLLAGCTKVSEPQIPATPETIVNTFIQSLSKGDVNTCLSLLADDVVFRQEPSGMQTNGKAPVEAGIQQLTAWHHQYSVVGTLQTEGNKVRLTIRETGDEYKIMGLEYITGDIEAEVYDGKIKAWTVTVNQEDIKKVAELTAGGIGIKFEATARGIKITEFAKNSPLYEAGARPGDLIIAVDGINYSQMREGEIQLRIKGPVGSKVKLTVTHEGAPAPTDIEVTRVNLAQLSY